MAYTSGIRSFDKHKAMGGKEIFLVKYRVANSKAEPGDDEFGTDFLDSSAIKALIEKVNEEGIPMLITIEYFSGYNTKFKEVEIPVLPMCVEKRKRDPQFTSRYEVLGSPAQTRDLIKKDTECKLYNLKTEINHQAEEVKEHIRRDLIKSYLKIKRSDPKHPIVSLVEGYNIVNKHYNIAKIKPDQIDAVRLLDVYKELQTPNMSEQFPDRDFKAVYDFSKKYQLEKAKTGSVCLVYGAGEHLVGLKKGATPAEREAIARRDAEAAEKSYFVDVVERGIVDGYTHSKLHKNGAIDGLFEESEPGK